MPITFDGASKLATLSAGTTALDVKALWSRWVDWFQSGDNSKWPLAMQQVGGDTIDATAGTSIPAYIYLLNGWRIKPQESNHTLNIQGGVLLVSGGGDPIVDTTGSFVVRVNYSQPVQAITVATGGGAVPSAAEVAAAVWANPTGAAIAIQLAEAWGRLGLDPSKPLVTGQTSITFGQIVMALTGDATNTTVTRQ